SSSTELSTIALMGDSSSHRKAMPHDLHGSDHDHDHDHAHDGRLFRQRKTRRPCDFRARAFTVGIGGPVGSGKIVLVLSICRKLRDKMRFGVVTNDIFTREDAEFLYRNEALSFVQIRVVETGGCPHAAIREDITPNLNALEQLMKNV